jgi:hypothetical protein
VSFGCVEQRVRGQDLVKVRRDSPISGYDAHGISACDRLQSMCGGTTCRMRHAVDDADDDAVGLSGCGYGEVRLARQ